MFQQQQLEPKIFGPNFRVILNPYFYTLPVNYCHLVNFVKLILKLSFFVPILIGFDSLFKYAHVL
jgi:hypothetical protein